MPDDNVNYEALSRQYQIENENLRTEIFKLRNSRSNIDLDIKDISKFIENNYFMVLICIATAYLSISLVLDFYKDRKIR